MKIDVQPYTKDFYNTYKEGMRRSAEEVVPLVIEMIRPKRVVDVGCGIGAWLSVFKESGVEEILGVDGDYVEKEMLQIPEEQFFSFDLKNPLRMDRQFDLAVSLETAEHLPSECAEPFVDSLTRLGPVVLFSAAIPFQGGTNHINEQWPDYWAKYFEERGYVAIDCIRKKIWQNYDVKSEYVQNIFMFGRRDYVESHSLLKKEFENTNISQLSIVHPRQFLHHARLADLADFYSDPKNISLKSLLLALPTLMRRALMYRIRKLYVKQ